MKTTDALPPLTREQLDLFESHWRFAYKFVHQMWRQFYATREDAAQVALLALANAARLFDPARGVTFGTYAGNAIRNELLKGGGQQHLIRLPQNVATDLARVASGRAAECRSKPRTLAAAYKAQTAGHFDHQFSDGDTIDYIASAVDPADEAARREEVDEVNAVLAKMTRTERLVLQHTYGIGDCKAMTRIEIGAMLGVSASRIGQIREEARHRFALYSRLRQQQRQAARERKAVSA